LGLVDSFREFYSEVETQKAEVLTASHQANVSAIDARVACLNEQIVRVRLDPQRAAPLYSQRKDLLSKRDQESRHLAVLKSIMLSPVRRVPTDVLCEIFVHCLPKTISIAPRNWLLAKEPPLLLCHVCSKWRRTAINFHTLWKALVLPTSYTFKNDTQSSFVHPSVSPTLNSWFARAGTCFLSLGLNLFYEEGTVRSGLTVHLEDVLNRLPVSRLQHLSLSTFLPNDVYFLSRISQEFTQLESIVLKAEHDGGVLNLRNARQPDHLLQSAPRLHSAELHNFIYVDAFPKYFLPWSQLTHLRVEKCLGERMWYILICCCTNLQHGIFWFDCGSEHDPTILPSSHDITLPHLFDLTVYVTNSGETPNFRKLVFPALRRLQLLFGRRDTGIYTWRGGNFPGTNITSLTSLALVGLIFFTDGAQILPLLEPLPSITELHLSLGINYTSLFRALTNPQLLPKLEIIHFDIQNLRDAETSVLQPLVSFVQSRWWDDLNLPTSSPVTQLQCLTLKFSS
jgi:hypothetical protein